MVDFAGGVVPGVTRYRENWGDSTALNGWLDLADLHLAGDFMGLKRKQVMHINQDGGGGKVMILDYANGIVPGTVRYWETWGQSSLLNGWLDAGDQRRVGDFLGLGRSQVMYVNRSGAYGKVMIVDYAGGAAPGAVRYLESWGQNGLLNGWLDDNDLQRVGDFMGLGRSQVMYVNRGGSGGKVMIVDYAKGVVPGLAYYFESWGQDGLLNGWLDDGDLQLVGDFMGLGHSQVMYVNRGGSGGKVMIVDYAKGVVPGLTYYLEMWGQTTQLNGWLDHGDLQLVGDFMGLGRSQVMYVNRGRTDGKVMIVDYASGKAPGAVRYWETWGQNGLLDDGLDAGDQRVVGDFTGVGHDTLQSWNLEDPAQLAATFAPRLRFDGAALNYPMSAQTYYTQVVQTGNLDALDNQDYASIAANWVPTYYQTIDCGNQLRIMYWWFYGYQSACDPILGNGAHHGDWEQVMVTLSEDRTRIAAVTYWAHGHHYTRLPARGGVAMEEGTHPIVYPGKLAHASYFDQGGTGTCAYWDDFHNNGSGYHMDSWKNLVSLDNNAEPWMVADRAGGFVWGWNGVSNHPTQHPPSCQENACSWGSFFDTSSAQDFFSPLGGDSFNHTQCEYGDDDTGVGCIAECRPGYTNTGLFCSTWTDTYARQFYSYDWTIPTSDVGLLSSAY